MKVRMKTSEEKGGSSFKQIPSVRTVKIAVIGLHDVGKSALTVRYLTRRYIGEYKSNADLTYRQTLTIHPGAPLDIEIVDISTREANGFPKAKPTFPVEEMDKVDAIVLVYSVIDRDSYKFASQFLSDFQKYRHQLKLQKQQETKSQPNLSSSVVTHPQRVRHHSSHLLQNSPILQELAPPKLPNVVLIANKCDLEHMRDVERFEGLSTAVQYGCHFNEVSVADNSPEIYQSFVNLISGFSKPLPPPPPQKRKFSVSRMLNNFRLGRTRSPSPQRQRHQIMTSQASIVDTSSNMYSDYYSTRSLSSSQSELRAPTPPPPYEGDIPDAGPNTKGKKSNSLVNNNSNNNNNNNNNNKENNETTLRNANNTTDSTALAPLDNTITTTAPAENIETANNGDTPSPDIKGTEAAKEDTTTNIDNLNGLCADMTCADQTHNHPIPSLCHLKSKMLEFHSLKRRHNSPPICSL